MNTIIKAALPLVLVLPACGSSKSSKDVADNVGNISELQGAWQGNCHAPNMLADLVKTGFTQERYDFGRVQNRYSRSVTAFNDGACNQAGFTLAIEGGYDVVNNAQLVDGAKSINLTIEKATVTAKTADGVEILNAGKFCGESNWALNQVKEVTNKECAGMKLQTGQVVFDLYKVDGDQLRTGKASFFNAGTAAATRPTALDKEQVFTKK